ncbi:MAG: class I SAM-dependent methyltransferase, partial [Desulfobacteraceae bacterium]|nr:class I SAM-dependent methyltransferase [Desulfobacteraceae bacterium]
LKANWQEYLHGIRKRELDILFSHLPEDKIFDKSLELGAGDGFQSEILAKRVKHLISTDINPQRLRKESSVNIEYKICDAELIDTYFEEKSFDFIFSSNLLEHLPDPERALQGIYRILKDDGITAHIVPSPFYKLAQMFLFYPNLLITKLEALMETESPFGFLAEKISIYMKKQNQRNAQLSANQMGNNPKVLTGRRYSALRKLFWPVPHGASDSNWKEFQDWNHKRWLNIFSKSGFTVIKVAKGPVFSGYGFGFDRIRIFLENMGLSSEYIYVAVKEGKTSAFRHYF